MKILSPFLILIFFGNNAIAQNDTLTLGAALNIVNQYHPMVRLAHIQNEKARAALVSAKGAFDPKIFFIQNTKDFSGLNYYNLNSLGLEVSTLSPVSFTSGFENNTGNYLNPENKNPTGGLYSTGVTISLLKNTITDKHRTQLRQAEVLRDQSEFASEMMLNDIYLDILTQYSLWLQAYQEQLIYEQSIAFCKDRLSAIREELQVGARAEIDTLETFVLLQNFEALRMQAAMESFKYKLALSAHLWFENATPLSIKENTVPSQTGLGFLDSLVNVYSSTLGLGQWASTHPGIQTLEKAKEIGKLDLRLKKQDLLPELKLKYNFLQAAPFGFSDITSQNQRFGVNFSTPVFLRTERGNYAKSRLELESLELKLDYKSREILLKNEAALNQLNTYKSNLELTQKVAEGYRLLYFAELDKNDAGASDLFLINTRQLRLTDAELKLNNARYKFLQSKLQYLHSTGTLYMLENALIN